MAFVTTKFAAEFQLRLLENIQTVLERDAPLALAELDSDLATNKPFADFKTPVAIAVNFPAVYIEPGSTKNTESADASHIWQEHDITIWLSVVDSDADALKVLIAKYLLAIDRALRTMTQGDLTGGITTAIGPAEWDVTEHAYSGISVKETIYRRNAFLTLVIRLMER